MARSSCCNLVEWGAAICRRGCGNLPQPPSVYHPGLAARGSQTMQSSRRGRPLLQNPARLVDGVNLLEGVAGAAFCRTPCRSVRSKTCNCRGFWRAFTGGTVFAVVTRAWSSGASGARLCLAHVQSTKHSTEVQGSAWLAEYCAAERASTVEGRSTGGEHVRSEARGRASRSFCTPSRRRSAPRPIAHALDLYWDLPS